jgi:hypothetical protein
VERDVRIARASWQKPPWRWVAAAVVVAALVVSGLVFTAGGLGDHGVADTDGDGLSNEAETSGWRTEQLGAFVTDPHNPDSDGDGLSDGQEAGALTVDQHFKKVYAGLSNPGLSDTDGDGVGDGDEYFLDMNPRLGDTDEDGLVDKLELEFGSDPTLDNPDGDSYADKEEYDRGSDPLAYDLDHAEAVAAFLGGATAGEWEWGARHLGRLREEQLQSPEYLAGQIASGVLGIGDLRDFVADIGKLDLVAAVVSAVGLAPVAGDAAKTVATLTKFAKRGDRAERAASSFVQRLPWSTSTKRNILEKIFGSATKLPKILEGGSEGYSVYKASSSSSSRYVGITKDFDRRRAEHAGAGRKFTPELIKGASGLSWGEARAIEEACIVQGGLMTAGGVLENQIHSISPALPYHDDAVRYGIAKLKKVGSTCL